MNRRDMAVEEKAGTEELIISAFENQNRLNMVLHPDWQTRGWNYYRAVWTELAEAIMHTNWCWWKEGTYEKQMTPAQLVELHIELCDVLHFGLSLDILRHTGRMHDRVQEYMAAFDDAAIVSCDLTEDLEGIVVDAILLHEFNIKKFARACHGCGLYLPGLLTFYFAKTALNEFRWANGYNDKTYVKMWQVEEFEKPIEDNTYLGQLVTAYVASHTKTEVLVGIRSRSMQSNMQEWLAHKYLTMFNAPKSRKL